MILNRTRQPASKTMDITCDVSEGHYLPDMQQKHITNWRLLRLISQGDQPIDGGTRSEQLSARQVLNVVAIILLSVMKVYSLK